MKNFLKNVLHKENKNGIMRAKLEVFVNSNSIVSLCKKRHIKVSVYLLESMQDKHTESDIGYVCKNEHMINIVDAAKYLIQLYYKTGSRYHCTRTKIEKMLSIANLVGLKSGTVLFAERNVVNPCGTGFPILASFIFGDILDGREIEDCLPIARELINEGAVYPPAYKIDNYALIPPSICELLVNIFLRFGNFDAKTLGVICDEFKNKIAVNLQGSDTMVIDNDAVKPFFENQVFIEEYTNNVIFSFIVNYGEI